MTVDAVRGALSAEFEREVLDHWAEHTLLRGDEAVRRLDGVVCTRRDRAGRITAVGSVEDVVVPLVGGRRFWLYRQSTAGPAEALDQEMLQVAFDVVDEEVDPSADLPGGLCVFLDDPDAIRAQPEAIWPGSGMLHAGYLPTGAQVRVRYCRRSWSSVGDAELEERYRIVPFEAEGSVAPEAIIELWTGDAGLSLDEAQRRISEVVLVALDPDGTVVGVATAYPQHNAQLRLDLWYYRTFVATGHRMTNIAVQLTHRTVAHLEEGRRPYPGSARPAGVAMEVENEGLKTHLPGGLWATTGFAFIGSNPRGDHVRVRYFPGSVVDFARHASEIDHRRR